jgi:hypothetical protein
MNHIFQFSLRYTCAELFQGPEIFTMKTDHIRHDPVFVSHRHGCLPGTTNLSISSLAYLTNLVLHAIGHRSLFRIIILRHPGRILAGVQDDHKKIWIPAQNFAGMTLPYHSLSLFRPKTASRMCRQSAICRGRHCHVQPGL